MHKKDLKIVERFKELVSKKATVNEVMVFGSRARGDATWESDLDLLVVVEHLDHSIDEYISECAWEAGFEDGIVVVPISITIDKLKNSPIRESAFIKNVYREGVAV